MIPYYEKNCYETPITSAKSQRLTQALSLLNKKYDPLINIASKSAKVSARTNDNFLLLIQHKE
jgi:hypothetical protein